MSKDTFLHNLEKLVAGSPFIYRFLKKCKVGYQTLKYHLFTLIGKDKELIYNRSFFDKNLEWNIPIATTVVDTLIKYFHPNSVVDVGCGNAEFLYQFQKRGVTIKGYDGSHYAVDRALVDKKFIELFDLRNQIDSSQRYDLALCLEVAEHIERRYSKILIDSLAKLSDIVIFTAATPGQGGHFHINEQPKEFWIEIFSENDFIFDAEITKKVASDMEKKGVLSWYCKNLAILRKK